MPHEHTRRKKTQKYLRESCYHRIKCIAATFLATFMWRRPLNSAILVTTTHRKPKKVFYGIDTQVRAQMIDKCRIKMVQRELYNMRDPPWESGGKKREREHFSHQNYTCNQFNLFIWKLISSDSEFIQMFLVLAWSSFESVLAVVKFIRA